VGEVDPLFGRTKTCNRVFYLGLCWARDVAAIMSRLMVNSDVAELARVKE